MKVKIPRNIKKYQSKAIGPFTYRQAISIGVAFAVGIALSVLLWGKLDASLMCAIIVTIIAPILLMGFATIAGLKFEEALAKFLKSILFNIDKRPYKLTGINREKQK